MFLRKLTMLGGLIVSLLTIPTYAEAENKLLLNILNDEKNQLEVELPQGWKFDKTEREVLHLFVDSTEHRTSGIGIGKSLRAVKAPEPSIKIDNIPQILNFFFEPNSKKPIAIQKFPKDYFSKYLVDNKEGKMFYEAQYFFPFQSYKIAVFIRNDIGFEVLNDDVIALIKSLKIVPKSKPDQKADAATPNNPSPSQSSAR